MRKMRFAIVAIAVAGFLSLGSKCDEEKLTCEDAMDHFYGEGCAVFADGDMVSEYEAVDGCEDNEDDADDRDCKSEFKDALECLDEVDGQDECQSCNYEFEKMYNCLAFG